MELDQFLDAVITTPEGWFCLAIGKSGGVNWFERFYRWPAQRAEIVAAIDAHRGEHNIYFTSHLFSMASSQKANVLPTRTIQADLDEADVNHLSIKPSVLVNTSPGRHQAYWILDEELPLEEHEMLSRKLTYSIKKCDHSGWPLGHKVRIPDTFNFKYLDGPKPVEVIESSLSHFPAAAFEMLPEVPASAGALDVEDFVSSTEKIDAVYLGVRGPQELLESLQGKIAGKTYVQYNAPAADRSAALWALMCQAFAKGGLNREQVFFLAKYSKNNKFADLRHNGDRELAKDVLRAEALVRSQSDDPRTVILGLKSSGTAVLRRPEILRQVTSFMQERGQFLHTGNDATWYIRRDIGRPIIVSERSEYLHTLMDIEYGLNATEAETSYSVHGLCAYARNLPLNGLQTALSYYDPSSRTVLLHTGRKDVLRITADRIDTIVDGSNSVIFPWQPTNEPFTVGPVNPDDTFDWAEVLFGQSANGDALGNLINLSRSDALALLRVWFLFLLFRNAAVSRPILATFGQPGSGKSTLFRKVYALLYGRYKSVGSVTTQEDFDHGVAYDPFVVLDNVDTPERWLPDRLALSASTSDIVKRKLYTDADTVVLKRQALVGITAHNPRFGREDVADRLLLLTFERLEHFIPEQVIIDRILKHRTQIWGAIVRDVQKVLATPITAPSVQFRVEDFAWLGMWIANALGCPRELASALEAVKFGQRSFSLEEDAMLVTALRRIVETDPLWVADRTPSQLWARLERASTDPQSFVKTYRNSTALGKKLLSLQDALKLTFEITWKQDKLLSTKLWTIKERSPNGHANGAVKE